MAGIHWISSLIVATALAGADAEFKPLFNGTDLTGWDFVPYGEKDRKEVWTVEDGMIVCQAHGGGWLSTPREYADFELLLHYRLTDGANSGVFIRTPRKGRASRDGMEIQIIDEHSPRYNDPKHKQYYDLKPYQRTGAVYGVQPPSKIATKPAGEWNVMKIRAKGRKIQVTINGEIVVDCDLDKYPASLKEHPGILNDKGYIGISSHNDRIEFRNIMIREL